MSQFGGIPLDSGSSRFGGILIDTSVLNSVANELQSTFADQPNTVYGDVLPFQKNTQTGETSFATPEMLRAPLRGVGDLIRQAQNRSTHASPDSLAAMATIIPAGKQIESLGELVGPAVSRGLSKVEQLTQKAPGILGDSTSGRVAGPMPVSPSNLADAKTNAYAAAGQNNEVFPNLGTDLAGIINNAKAKPLPGGAMTSENQAFNNAIDEFSTVNGHPLTIEHVQQIDKDLGAKIDNAFGSGDKTLATKLLNVQDDFRDAIKGSDAGQTLSDARDLASANFKSNDLQKVLDNSVNYDNPSTYIRNQFRQIQQNTRRFNAYDEETQAIISKIAKGGFIGDQLGILGSRLNGIIGGVVGGPAAGVAANVSSTAARGAKNALYANRAQKAVNSVGEQVRPLVEQYNTQGPVYQPQPTIAGQLTYQPQVNPIGVSPSGVAVTAEDRAILGQAPPAPVQPTLQDIAQMKAADGLAALNDYLRQRKTMR